MKKILYFIFIFSFISLPIFINADGVSFKPMPEGDLILVDEKIQQAFINYNSQDNIEKLIISVDVGNENSNFVWIVPIPGTPEETKIDIISQLPVFIGDNIISKTKIQFSESFKDAYYASTAGQIWTLPFQIIFISLGEARIKAGLGDINEEMSNDSVSVENHIEKNGMTAELITTKNIQALYDYLSKKNLKVEEKSLNMLNSYINNDYVFVVSWISGTEENNQISGERGIFVIFSTPKIYYPLIPTSAYGEKKIPIEIRILGHVKPDLSPTIESFTKIDYFTKRTLPIGYKGHFCEPYLYGYLPSFIMFYDEHGYYPYSLKELENSVSVNLIDNTNRYCYSPLLYYSNGENFSFSAFISSDLIFTCDDSLTCSEKEIKKEDFLSPELQEFYGDNNVWRGDAEYTKITINAPAKFLTHDLWVMEEGRPLKISLATFIINNPLIISILLYFIFVSIFSFLAGGIAGLICYRNFRRFAWLGLANLATLIGLMIALKFIKKKGKIEVFKWSFIILFSVLFLSFIFFIWLLL